MDQVKQHSYFSQYFKKKVHYKIENKKTETCKSLFN